MAQLNLNLLFYPTNNFSRFILSPNTKWGWKEFNAEVDSYNYNNIFSEPKSEPDLYYFTYQYKLLDLMGQFANLPKGLFISQKCLEVFQTQLRLPPYKAYPIFYKKKDKIVSDYHYIYFYFGLRNSINYDKSFFKISDNSQVGDGFYDKVIVDKNVQFKDFDDFNNRLFVDYFDKNLEIEYEHIVFTKDSISKFDIFPIYLGLESEFYLTDKFLEVFAKEKMTGLDTRPFNSFEEED